MEGPKEPIHQNPPYRPAAVRPDQTITLYKVPEYILGMQCPYCGYEVDDDAVFCPQCRFQFREVAEEQGDARDRFIKISKRGVTIDESLFEETKKTRKGFSEKELRELRVQLITPAVLVILMVSLFVYTVISSISLPLVTVAGFTFGLTGIICLSCGLLAGIIFFAVTQWSLRNFRYR